MIATLHRELMTPEQRRELERMLHPLDGVRPEGERKEA